MRKVTVGIDEVGRGPLAGPVVACAVVNNNIRIRNLRDSKKLSPKQREEIYSLLKHKAVWATARVSEKVIDRINIRRATRLAMKRAVNKLKIVPDVLLIDGNMSVDMDIQQKSIIKGDQKIRSIMMASIIAKVTRDRIMVRYHKKYPKYRFDKHKGYGTKQHIKAIRKHGPCPIHRKTFEPVKSI